MKFDVTNVQYEGPTLTTMLKKEQITQENTTWHTVHMCYLVVGAFLLIITW